MLFFSENDIFTQLDRKSQLEKLNKDIDYLKSETEEMSQTLDQLEQDPEMVKKIAREKYHYKQADEDVFLITQDTIYQPAK